jgi:hypothetical protein
MAEAARTAFVASLVEAVEAGHREGFVSADEVAAEALALIVAARREAERKNDPGEKGP